MRMVLSAGMLEPPLSRAKFTQSIGTWKVVMRHWPPAPTRMPSKWSLKKTLSCSWAAPRGTRAKSPVLTSKAEMLIVAIWLIRWLLSSFETSPATRVTRIVAWGDGSVLCLSASKSGAQSATYNWSDVSGGASGPTVQAVAAFGAALKRAGAFACGVATSPAMASEARKDRTNAAEKIRRCCMKTPWSATRQIAGRNFPMTGRLPEPMALLRLSLGKGTCASG